MLPAQIQELIVQKNACTRGVYHGPESAEQQQEVPGSGPTLSAVWVHHYSASPDNDEVTALLLAHLSPAPALSCLTGKGHFQQDPADHPEEPFQPVQDPMNREEEGANKGSRQPGDHSGEAEWRGLWGLGQQGALPA